MHFRASRRLVLTAVAVSATLALSACGGGGDPLANNGSGGSSGAAAPSQTIVVGSANFTESQILAEIYAQALQAKGVTVDKKLNIGSRETYIPALEDGSIDLLPEYTGTLLQYIDKTATATAPDKDAVVVTQDTATKYNAKSIEDLAANCGQIVFGGPPEFQTRPDGIPGIAKTYNCNFKSYQSLDAGGPLTVGALKNGDVQAADIFTTDASIPADDFVVLADPKNNFAAQNVVPLINSAKATDQVKQVLNSISAKLTTEGLIELNRQLDSPEKPDPNTVAKTWLGQNGLG
jgi:osmoprotectant transport system substrate-binding protein